MQEIIPLAKAKRLGLKYYFTGVACKHGHISQRLVSVRKCQTCNSVGAAHWQRNNKERYLEKQAEWVAKSKAAIAARCKAYYQRKKAADQQEH